MSESLERLIRTKLEALTTTEGEGRSIEWLIGEWKGALGASEDWTLLLGSRPYWTAFGAP